MNKATLSVVLLLSIFWLSPNAFLAKDSTKVSTPKVVKSNEIKTSVEKKVTKNSAEPNTSAGAGDKEHEGMIFVKGYTKKDGTKVEGYWRKKSKKN